MNHRLRMLIVRAGQRLVSAGYIRADDSMLSAEELRCKRAALTLHDLQVQIQEARRELGAIRIRSAVCAVKR